MLALFLALVAARPAHAEIAAEFTEHRGEDAELRFALSSTGRVLTAVGRFDVGLAQNLARDPAAIAEATKHFLNSHQAAFGLHDPYALDLQPRYGEDIDADLFVIHYDQFDGELRLLHAEVTVGVYQDGTIQSVNSAFFEPQEWIADGSRTTQEIAELAEGAGSPRHVWVRGEAAGSYADGPYAKLERGIDPHRGTVVWELRDGDDIWIVDEFSGDVERRDGRNPSTAGTCTATFEDFPRRAVTLKATSLQNTSGTNTTESAPCEGSAPGAQCVWTLKREDGGVTHPMARIDDYDSSSEVEVFELAPCDSGASFTATSGDSRQEQTAFVAMQQMRYWTLQNVWNWFSPNRTANVELSIGSTLQNYSFFSDAFTDIDVIPSQSGRYDIMAHEFGHYVVWSYDDVSLLCVEGFDHGLGIDESMADVFGLLALLDDGDVNPEYRAPGNFDFASQFAVVHSSSNNITFLENCDTDQHLLGLAFEQAVWELLFGRDCVLGPTECTTAADMPYADDVWAAVDDQEDAITSIGRATGSALKTLGQNITYQQLVVQIVSRVSTDSTSTIAGRVDDVFEHHNL